MYHKKSNQGLLLEQISNYINHAPYRRIKRSGSLGLSDNSVRNLIVFKKLIEDFEQHIGSQITLKGIDHMLVNMFKEWLLTNKGYSLNNTGLQLKLLKMICKEEERMSIPVNPYTRHIESFTQKSRDRVFQTISFEEIKKIKSLKNLPSTLENGC